MALSRYLPKLFTCKLRNNTRVHSWSPLAAAFNNKIANAINLLFREHKGLFNVPELASPEGFHLLKEHCVRRTDSLIKEAISINRNRKIVEVFDEISDTLCKVADLAEFIRIAHPNPLYANAAENACIAISSIVEKLNTNVPLHAALKDVVENGDKFFTNDVDEHVAQLFLFDFEQCGINLPEKDRALVVELNNSILHLGQHFVSGTSISRSVKKSIIPENIRHMFTSNGGTVSVSRLHADAKDPRIREIAYRIYLSPNHHQEELLNDLLYSRHKLAKLCGFETYSERALKGSLVETPEVVISFLNLLSESLENRAAEDYKTMNKMKLSEYGPNFGILAAWDIPYFSYKYKKDNFNINNSEYSPYFSLGACMDGLNNLMKSLYGITLVHKEMSIGESWFEDVYKLEVTHENDEVLGYIYCDVYERQGKQNQDCHFTIQGGKELKDGTYQLPIVVLMLNLPKPVWPTPSLLTPGMVDNLFHEMGHAMHSMLARTKYQHVTGTRCSTDFAEVPSVLMEYFANDPRVIVTYARHFQTGAPIPETMLAKLCASKHIFSASEMQMQVFYSMLDQVYHNKHPLEGNTTEVLSNIQNKYYGIPHVQNSAWQLRFSHLFGYGAKYYSYLISRAVASWIWQQYFESNPLCREHGELYRNECLAHGGGKPPKQLVSDFLQREVTPEKLVNCLIKEIHDKNKEIEKIKTVCR